MMEDAYRALALAALGARETAYAPYSHFPVGAALMTASGELYTGCNVENASFPAGCCAERVALFSAIAAGEREFAALAVAGGGEGADYCVPCGICRQALAEFCQPNLVVLAVSGDHHYRRYTLGELLPEAFGAAQLEKGAQR